MEEDCECLFCQRDDTNLYEINQNSILINSELVDFNEIIYEIFNAHSNNDVVNYICEDCKDIITQFYIFKLQAKSNLVCSPIFDKLKKFLLNANDKSEPVLKCTKDQFIVSFVEIDEQNVQYSLVRPIVKIKAKKDVPRTTRLESMPQSPDIEEVEMKFQESETEGFQEEEEVYAVESIMEADENDDDENYFVEEEEPKTEPEEVVKMEVSPRKTYTIEQVYSSPTESKSSHTTTQKRRATSNDVCCGVAFKDFKCFQIHQKAHENFEAIVPHLPTHSCSDCSMLFCCEEDLMVHLDAHSGSLDFVLERQGAFEDHFVRNISQESFEAEDDGELFTCGHCKKKHNENDMKVHLLFFHTTTVVCPFDNRCFDGIKHVRLFSDHIRNKHPEIFDKILLYSCRHCKQSFTNNFEKLAHMKLCNAKPYQCVGHCNKRFASEWLLKNHLKIVNGDDRFACEICGKKCVSKSDLDIHGRMHTNERPYPCPICHKKFKTSANRSSHMDIHEPEKKHECTICGEKFQTRPILRKHKKVHDEKYQEECFCKICDRKYVTRQHLLRHLKSAHSAKADMTADEIGGFFTDNIAQ